MSQVDDKIHPTDVLCALCGAKMGETRAARPGETIYGVCYYCKHVDDLDWTRAKRFKIGEKGEFIRLGEFGEEV